MKKISHLALFVIVLVGLLGMAGYGPAFAKNGPGQLAIGQPAIIPFSALGEQDMVLMGPYSSANIRFSLPANWKLQDGAEMMLIISSFFTGDTGTTPALSSPYIGATLNVSFNGQLLTTIFLQSGNNVQYKIPVPVTALTPTRQDGLYEVNLLLNAAIDCDYNFHKTTVVVTSTSQLTLPYIETVTSTPLANLPRPFYQSGSIIPQSAMMVIPDSPSASELQAALTVAASFGRLTAGRLPISLITSSQFTEAIRNGSNLIFVGKASSLPVLGGLQLPATIKQSSQFDFPGMQTDDGILQMAVSPWNSGKALLVVGGNTDAGVVKAAQALSTGNVLTDTDPNVSTVAQVNPGVSVGGGDLLNPLTNVDRTFADLGYKTETITGLGIGDAYFQFFIPFGLTATETPYVDLVFSNSALLDYTRSGLTVFLNGQFIGSSRFSDETAKTVTQRIQLPIGLLRSGSNLLTVEPDLFPLEQCAGSSFANLWATVHPESVLHLPLVTATASSVGILDLNSYPYPFSGDPTIGNVAFVLPKQNLADWNVAAQIAFDLGRRASGAVYSPLAVFDGELTDSVRQNHDLIVIGVPKESQTIADLQSSLPASFEKGSNIPVVKDQQVVYRLAESSNVGYLELLPSVWNDQRSVLAVLGTTDAGVGAAGNALTTPVLLSNLKGDFAVVSGTQILTVDTRTGFGLGGLPASILPASTPAAGPSGTVAGQPSNAAPAVPGSTWIPLVVIGLIVLMVIVIGIAILSRTRGKKRFE